MVAASSQGPRVHESHRLEFRDEINRHQNATFANEANGLCYVSVVSVEEVPGGMHTWDLSIDSASHLFAVDCGMLVHNTNPAPVHRPVYNQAAAGEKIVWLVKPGAAPYFREWKNAGTEEAHNIVRGPICMGDERLAHPAQKPEWLIEKFIKRHASRRLGTRVLDPFAGVGTTPAVCKRLKLPCVGIEKEGKYVELAEARLATVQARKRRPRKKRVV